MDELIGKTIVAVLKDPDGYSSNRILQFTDGTMLEVVPEGYEVEGVGFYPLTETKYMARIEAAAYAEERRRNTPVVHNDMTVTPILKALYADVLAEAMQMRSDMNRTLYGGFTATMGDDDAS